MLEGTGSGKLKKSALDYSPKRKALIRGDVDFFEVGKDKEGPASIHRSEFFCSRVSVADSNPRPFNSTTGKYLLFETMHLRMTSCFHRNQSSVF
jgi:hypothetical protein